MRVSQDHPLWRTHALLEPVKVQRAIECFCEPLDKAHREGVFEVIAHPPFARAAVVALSALMTSDDPLVFDALSVGLASSYPSVQHAAIQAVAIRNLGDQYFHELLRLVETSSTWIVRREAVRALVDHPGEEFPAKVLAAATDPHWRIRHSLIQGLLLWATTQAQQEEIDEQLRRMEIKFGTERTPGQRRIQGLRRYLQFRWTGQVPRTKNIPTPPDLSEVCPFWDWDPAVMVRTLEQMGAKGRQRVADILHYLFNHEDERVRVLAIDGMRLKATTEHLIEAAALLDDPRSDAYEAAQKLLGHLNMDRAEELAKAIFQLDQPTPGQFAWMLDQLGETVDFEEPVFATKGTEWDRLIGYPESVTAAFVRAQFRRDDVTTGVVKIFLECADRPFVLCEALRGFQARPDIEIDLTPIHKFLKSKDWRVRAETIRLFAMRQEDVNVVADSLEDSHYKVRLALAEALNESDSSEAIALLKILQADVNPLVRAAALTESKARELIANPEQETSWFVLKAASAINKTPLWEIEPEEAWKPEARPIPELTVLRPENPIPPNSRLLGPLEIEVPPIGISGAYGLSVEGFVHAMESGINIFFWEQNYVLLTEFLTRLPVRDRNDLYLITGTFEADAKRITRDIDRALKKNQLERLGLFLVFWTRSWDRVSDEVRSVLEKCQQQGKLAMYGLSTHNRALAVQAMESGWNPVMVRHSGAHRGAEQQIFPKAVELGTSIITFNNTCYARLLAPHPNSEPPTAADCYRYTLEQPGVTMCLSAPANMDHLEENLSVIRDLHLSDDRRERLLKHGELVYQEDTVFRKLVRAL